VNHVSPFEKYITSSKEKLAAPKAKKEEQSYETTTEHQSSKPKRSKLTKTGRITQR
jgi:hypothetical protein